MRVGGALPFPKKFWVRTRLAVKGNQGHLYEAVVDFFETAQRAHFRGVPFDYHEETESGHGRIEVRRYWTTPVLTTLPDPSAWVGLKIIGMTESERHVGEKLTIERRYYIASLKSDARQFGNAVRGHWGIGPWSSFRPPFLRQRLAVGKEALPDVVVCTPVGLAAMSSLAPTRRAYPVGVQRIAARRWCHRGVE